MAQAQQMPTYDATHSVSPHQTHRFSEVMDETYRLAHDLCGDDWIGFGTVASCIRV
jgi:hypothetical protein